MPNKAIVVGIQAYPELPPALQGPRNDARRFHEWVTTVGGVAPGDATLILDDEPPAATALDAHPTAETLTRLFDALEAEALRQPNGRVGDRLYLYLSGHGFGQNLSDAALLMANATRERTRNNISGRLWADHFYANGFFKEVLLFLDCCRERYQPSMINGPGTLLSPVPRPGGRRFYGFASKYGKLAVEHVIDGRMGGVFTATLLDALGGGASEDDGRITAESLKAYLYENMVGFLSTTDLANKDVAREPELFCDAPEREFVIATVPPRRFQVAIPLPDGSRDRARQLFGEQDGRKFARIAQAAADGTSQWNLSLLRGTYQLLLGETPFIVTVRGRGVTDVVNA